MKFYNSLFFLLLSFWRKRVTLLIFSTMYCFILSIWHQYTGIKSSATDFIFAIAGSAWTFLLFRWWDNILMKGLNKGMVSINRFKKVMDCSKESICILNDNKLSYCNDEFILMFQSYIQDFQNDLSFVQPEKIKFF